MVTGSVAVAFVLTVTAFLHGTGNDPVARAWVVPSVEACRLKGETVKRKLLARSEVRDVRYFCAVIKRRDNT